MNFIDRIIGAVGGFLSLLWMLGVGAIGLFIAGIIFWNILDLSHTWWIWLLFILFGSYLSIKYQKWADKNQKKMEELLKTDPEAQKIMQDFKDRGLID